MKIDFRELKKWNIDLDKITRDKLIKGAEIVKAAARRRCPVGTITRPMYRRGKYAGQDWTSRDGGRLRKSIQHTKGHDWVHGIGEMLPGRSIAIIAGNYWAWYADIVEHDRFTPYMRPALEESIPMLRTLWGVE
jgi:hypothetical protein